jgi:hypothetical protein
MLQDLQYVGPRGWAVCSYVTKYCTKGENVEGELKEIMELLDNKSDIGKLYTISRRVTLYHYHTILLDHGQM